MSVDDLHPDRLYHLATTQEWEGYRTAGSITPGSIESEGFVHCSWGRQVAGTLERHFAGATGLLALEVDPTALGAVEIVEEDSYDSGQAFPHAYGPIPAAAVVVAVPVA
ncbi:MAG: DUF952 domain-containing protein [Actinobacteria bacterium]|nr:DUF952 domain-containing protein [Actinomycetota bacterium]